MSFREPVCRLKLVIKDKHKPPSKKHPQPVHHLNLQQDNTELSQIRWNLQSSKTPIAQQCPPSQITQIKELEPAASTMLDMMEKVVSEYKRQKSKSNSFRRSSSPQRAKQSFGLTKSRVIAQSQADISGKINIIREMKENNERLQLKGFRASTIRCESASKFDLQNRVNPTRCQTAKSTKRSSNLIERGQSSRSILSARKKHSRGMSFNPKNYEQQYQKKIKVFMDFLYKVNFSNGIYVDMQLHPIEAPIHKYKIYIGKGNNQQLLRELLKRRFWYEFTSSRQEYAHLYWTQFELPSLHQIQICKASKKGSQPQAVELETNSQSLVFSKTFEFRKQLTNSRTALNCKLMDRQQAQSVEQCIAHNAYSIFSKPFEFVTITNHIPGTSAFTIKKNLLINLKIYFEDVLDEDPFTVIPRSFHLVQYKGYEVEFFQHLANQDPKKLWMLKPGENTCRSEGIEIWPAPQILRRIKERWEEDDETCTFIIQSYIENPLLYHERKFDIRHYMLLTCINGTLKAYWYREGYIRTSSQPYPLVTKIKCRNPLAKKFKNEFNEQLLAWLKKREIHFTNDAVQKEHEDYGKHEPGNKLSYGDLQKYFDYEHGQYSFFQKIMPKMRDIAKNVLKSVKGKIDPQRRASNFELFGLDYILDEDFNVWLLQINNNPCLQTSSPVLDRVVPGVLEQIIRLCIQPLLPPHNHFPARERHNLLPDCLAALKFQLFYQEPM